MIYLLVAPWFVVLGFYTIALFYDYGWPYLRNKLDILQKGRRSKFKDTYTLILAHFLSAPDDWLIGDGFARFPKEGNMAKYTLRKEDNHLMLNFEALNNGKSFEITSAYFKGMFLEQMESKQKYKLQESIIRNLFPDGGLVLLEDRRENAQ